MICFRYMANTETYLKNMALKHMPPNLQKVSLLKSGEYIQGNLTAIAAGVWESSGEHKMQKASPPAVRSKDDMMTAL